MSIVIMKPLVPLNSKAFAPALHASTSLGIWMKPSLRRALSYINNTALQTGDHIALEFKPFKRLSDSYQVETTGLKRGVNPNPLR
jgi:hypothetical protein